MKTNELQLVTFEQAKRLKTVGFDWYKVEYYYKDNKKLNYAISNIQYNLLSDSYLAPSVALALKWFRDVEGFDYSIIKGRLPFEYSYSLLNGSIGMLHIKTYEAAESALLDELLTLKERFA